MLWYFYACCHRTVFVFFSLFIIFRTFCNFWLFSYHFGEIATIFLWCRSSSTTLSIYLATSARWIRPLTPETNQESSVLKNSQSGKSGKIKFTYVSFMSYSTHVELRNCRWTLFTIFWTLFTFEHTGSLSW